MIPAAPRGTAPRTWGRRGRSQRQAIRQALNTISHASAASDHVPAGLTSPEEFVLNENRTWSTLLPVICENAIRKRRMMTDRRQEQKHLRERRIDAGQTRAPRSSSRPRPQSPTRSSTGTIWRRWPSADSGSGQAHTGAPPAPITILPAATRADRFRPTTGAGRAGEPGAADRRRLDQDHRSDERGGEDERHRGEAASGR